MQLTFESLAELQDFVQWVQAARQVAPIEAAPKATIIVEDLPEGDGEAVGNPAVTSNDQQDVPVDKPARKRRTKAEMEAARAAETANPTSAEPADSAASESSTADSADTHVAPNAEQTVSEPVDKGDAAEFIKSRLAERSEVSQVEHLNLARTFIGKHGMEKYNASFPLAGLTPNVMGYSPADCATHAAALDFLSLE